MRVVDTSSEAETEAAGRDLARRLRPGAVVLLEGALGAGKTAFVRGLAAGLGIAPDAVSSPTFTIVQEYRPSTPARGGLSSVEGPGLSGVEGPGLSGVEGPGLSGVEGGGAVTLQHIDLYRLSSAEVDDLALEDLIEDQIAAIEWPDRWRRAPPDSVRVSIDVLEHDRRRITIDS